jgi:putative transposase
MARKLLCRTDFFPYHVYNRSQDRNFYPLDFQGFWNECAKNLCVLSWAFGFHIHAFVLMSNHFHLVVSTPDCNLDDGMRYFQTEISRWIHSQTDSQAFRFGGRYKWSVVRDTRHFQDLIRYVYLNPVRSGLVSQGPDYLWSSLSRQLGLERLDFPLITHDWQSSLPEIESTDFEKWLHQPMDEEQIIKFRLGLRRRIFSLPLRPTAAAKSSQVPAKRD